MAIMGYLGETGTIADGSIRFDGRELVGAGRSDAAGDPRPRHRHGLSGPDERAEPGQ